MALARKADILLARGQRAMAEAMRLQ